jgi:hypothetical protein
MAQNEIVQRISLAGAEDIQKQLADLGTAGEKAIGQIQNAAGGMSPALSGLSNIAATLRGAFSQVGEAFAPARDRGGRDQGCGGAGQTQGRATIAAAGFSSQSSSGCPLSRA